MCISGYQNPVHPACQAGQCTRGASLEKREAMLRKSARTVRPIFIRAKNSGLNSTFTGRGAARESFSVQWGSALLRESLEFLCLAIVSIVM